MKAKKKVVTKKTKKVAKTIVKKAVKKVARKKKETVTTQAFNELTTRLIELETKVKDLLEKLPKCDPTPETQLSLDL